MSQRGILASRGPGFAQNLWQATICHTQPRQGHEGQTLVHHWPKLHWTNTFKIVKYDKLKNNDTNKEYVCAKTQLHP